MERYAQFVIRHRKFIVAIFLVAAAVSAVMILGVKVNYNMVDYLPPSAPSTKALELMNEEFDQSVPNTSVMVRGVSISEGMSYKEQLAQLPGVESVLWLDSVADVTVPLEMQDAASVEGFYKNGNALYQVTIEAGRETEAVNAIRGLIGEGNAVAGEAPDKSFMENAASNEVLQAVAILLPIILLLLVLSTSSWLEPILFLAAIGVSILINMGTNLFFAEISFVTNSVGPILQLAVSLDYAIFLLHSFADYRKKYGDDVERAMRHAMKKSITAVAASAVTTLFGFVALTFMEMGIGADLGINLAKGIALSFISCMVFLPALTLVSIKLLDKTRHRAFLPSFAGANRVLGKIAVPMLIVVLVLVVPSFLGQSNTAFTYGTEDNNPEGRSWQETHAIADEFGESTIIVAMVPRGDVAKEYELGQELKELVHVTNVMSFASTVGTGIPDEILDESITEQFYSDNYARILIYTDTESEGDVAFATVEQVQDVIAEYYDEYHCVGESVNLYDMRNVVAVDNTRVNLIAIISIFLVLLITFKSTTLPFLLLFTIEAGIWINLAIPYFMGESINFLGYLVINTVQLGATVDYAILLTSYYMSNRQRMSQKQAIDVSMGQTFKSILISGTVLAVAGFTLSLTSSNPIVSGLGLLLCRGTLLSMAMVLCMLPALLRIFDRPTGRLTWRANFYKEDTGIAAGAPDIAKETK